VNYRLVVRLAISLAAVVARSSAAQSGAPAAPPAPALLAMRQELGRSMQTLKAQPTPPFFLSYEITETYSASVRGAYGTVNTSGDNRHRLVGVDLRVGTPTFDNTHAVPDGMGAFSFYERYNLGSVPLDDDVDAVRRALWYQTDQVYKGALEQLARAKAGAQLHVAPEDTSPDFSLEPPAVHREVPRDVSVDRAAWEKKIRSYSAPFARYADIFGGEATFDVEAEKRWYVNSDGAELQTSSAYYRLFISAFTRAADGMILPRYESYVAFSPDGLPSDSVVGRAVEKMIADLHALKKAPLVTAVTAPAILSGRASGVFFHEVFGHRVEGHRQKDEHEAQTFKGKVGERLLPRDLSVYFDPTQRRAGNVELAGSYDYDNEGVAARRVDVVSNGVFKGFLMSRSPIAGFAHSNGHGRRQPGLPAVARQSNLFVTTSKPVPHATLKRLLIAEIKRQQKPFGLIFDDIEGGFTLTTRFLPNAFEVMPIMVYRVFPDGREELVRGIDLIGTPLTAFSRIIAADDQVRVFNGVCGAESGYVPVSASSPAVLLSQIEVQRKEKAQEKPPILAPPGAVP
jgi:predicted Zn-dependent protease